jgi:hypothetical protein
MLTRFGTQLLNLLGGGVGFEQGMVDVSSQLVG